MNQLSRTGGDRAALLGPGDPPVFEIVNAAGPTPVQLVCDHASRAVPAALGKLGLGDGHFDRHIAYDIGAAEVTRRLAAALDAPAVLAGYSRLVIDCRIFSSLTAVPARRLVVFLSALSAFSSSCCKRIILPE